MERERKTKVITILALVVAVVGMSLGFAAFFNILTISSSATVTPNEEDFKMKIYGIIGDNIEVIHGSDVFSYTSETSASALMSGGYFGDVPPYSGTDAIIDNNLLEISNLSGTFTEPGQSAMYLFVIKNIGEYNSFIRLFEYLEILNGVEPNNCKIIDEATESLVTSACKGVKLMGIFLKLNAEGNEAVMIDGDYLVDKAYSIAPGDFIYFAVNIDYMSDSARADGSFAVTFDNIKLDFSTTE